MSTFSLDGASDLIAAARQAMNQGSLVDWLQGYFMEADPEQWLALVVQIEPDPQLLITAMRGAIQQLEAHHLSPRSLALRQWLAEQDPSDRPNLITLLHVSARQRNAWEVLIWTSSLVEAWKSGDPPAMAPVLPLLDHLLAFGFGEAVLDLGEALAQRQTEPDLRAGILSVLAQLARQFAPERVMQYAPHWQPLDLACPAAAALIRALNHGSLAIAMGILATARQLGVDTIARLGLMANGIRYLSSAGHLLEMQAAIQELLTQWDFETCRATGRPLTEAEQEEVAFIILFVLCYDWPYVADQPDQIRGIQRQAAARFSHFTQRRYSVSVPLQPPQPLGSRPLRVGYMGAYFRRHSVGFLSHHTLAAHDPEQVSTYLYYLDPPDEKDDIYCHFRQQAGLFRECDGLDPAQVTEQIRADHLDVLVYMSGLEHRLGCEVIALRAAPIQLSWLAGDSPGLSELDGFLVDPYLLPEQAQPRYAEPLLRLPTFAAVAGFAVDPVDPAWLKQTLQIPSAWTVFWTAAPAKKRSPESIRCQIEILAQVPDSVLVVKGAGDSQAVIQLFEQQLQDRFQDPTLAQRIRFLARTPTQEQHRGQLAMADLILDTFPYAGSTHTLEALTLGIPVLTLAGEHYYTRQSYSLLKNCPLQDCITHSPEEFVLKGIQLGSDRDRLAQLKAKIVASQSTSPLWDPQQLARALETTYQGLVKTYPS